MPAPPAVPAAAAAREAIAVLLHCGRWLAAVPLYHLGGVRAYRRWRERRLQDGEVRVLRYHRIIPDGDAEATYALGVRRRSFAGQARLLAREFHTVDLAGAERRLAGEGRGRGMSVLITFDDGYRDNLTEGVPELERAGLRAALFVATGAVSTGARFPWERLKRVVEDPARTSLALPGGEALPLEGGWPRARRRAFVRLHRWLERLPVEEREAILALWESWRSPDPRNDGPLDWNGVREAAARGLDVGSHTVRHLHLTRLGSADLATELVESRRRLEEELGVPIVAIAYPSGDHDERVTRATAQAGYRLGFTTVPGSNTPGASPLRLRRKGIGEATAETPWGRFSPSLFAVEVSGLYDHLLRGIFP
jgi:peptidoglycan/xylan/chitin deacetylase (PgdA/CDA1 family)